MTHTRAVSTMVGATFLCSIAGVVVRQLECTEGFDITL